MDHSCNSCDHKWALVMDGLTRVKARNKISFWRFFWGSLADVDKCGNTFVVSFDCFYTK